MVWGSDEGGSLHYRRYQDLNEVRLFILVCDGSDRRLVTYRKIDQISTCIDDNRPRILIVRKGNSTWTGEPCGTGMELEFGMNIQFLICTDIEFFIDGNVDSLGLSTDKPGSSATEW